jgi:hypothetical protein
MTRNTLTGWKQAFFAGSTSTPRKAPWVDDLDTAQRSTAPHATELHVIDVAQTR